MTESKEEFLKNNWLTFSNMLLLIGLIVNISMWRQRVDDRIEMLEKHSRDVSVHMPLEKKIEIFTTRRDYEALEDKIDDINKKVDLILERELSKNR